MNKYIIFHKKYLELRNMIGGAEYKEEQDEIIDTKPILHIRPCKASDESFIINPNTCKIFFHNRHNSCWLIVSLIILFSSDSTRECVQENLKKYTAEEILSGSYHLLKYLIPEKEIINKKSNIINIITFIKNRIDNNLFDYEEKNECDNTDEDELPPIIPSIQRQNSIKNEIDIIDNYIKLLYKNKKDIEKGADDVDKFFSLNLLSILLYNNIIDFIIYNTENYEEINLDQLQNIIGIFIIIEGHIMALYVCNGEQKFCNNHNIINFQWYDLLYDYNELINTKNNVKIICSIIKDIQNKIMSIPFIKYEDEDSTIKYNYYHNDFKNTTDILFDIDEIPEITSIILLSNYSALEKNQSDYNALEKNQSDNYYYYLAYYIRSQQNLQFTSFIRKYKISFEDYYTLLDECFINTNYDIIKYIFDKDMDQIIDLNTIITYEEKEKDYNESFLNFACNKKDITLVNLLLTKNKIYNKIHNKNKINLNIKNNNNEIALNISCRVNNNNIVYELLQQNKFYKFNKHNLNNQDKYGFTPLIMACKNNNSSIIKLLLNEDRFYSSPNRLNLNLQNNLGNTALHYLCKHNNTKIINILYSNKQIDIIKNNNNEIPINIFKILCELEDKKEETDYKYIYSLLNKTINLGINKIEITDKSSDKIFELIEDKTQQNIIVEIKDGKNSYFLIKK